MVAILFLVGFPLVLFLSFLRNHQRFAGEYSIHAREKIEEVDDEQKNQ